MLPLWLKLPRRSPDGQVHWRSVRARPQLSWADIRTLLPAVALLATGHLTSTLAPAYGAPAASLGLPLPPRPLVGERLVKPASSVACRTRQCALHAELTVGWCPRGLECRHRRLLQHRQDGGAHLLVRLLSPSLPASLHELSLPFAIARRRWVSRRHAHARTCLSRRADAKLHLCCVDGRAWTISVALMSAHRSRVLAGVALT